MYYLYLNVFPDEKWALKIDITIDNWCSHHIFKRGRERLGKETPPCFCLTLYWPLILGIILQDSNLDDNEVYKSYDLAIKLDDKWAPTKLVGEVIYTDAPLIINPFHFECHSPFLSNINIQTCDCNQPLHNKMTVWNQQCQLWCHHQFNVNICSI